MSGSARIGDPPNTEDDYYIVRAIIRNFHLDGRDPAKGIHLGKPPVTVRTDTRAPQIIAAAIVCIVLITIVSGSRLAIRAFHSRVKWGWDDSFLILAAGFVIAWFVVYILQCVYGGGGQHIYNLTYHQYYMFDKLSKTSMLMHVSATSYTTLSLTLFIRRLIGLSSRFWIWVNNVFLALVSLYLIGFMFWVPFRCAPVSATFSLIAAGKLTEPLKCHNINPAAPVRVYAHVAFDFCLLSTPVIILWKVQMPLAKKLRVLATFSLGAVSSVAAVLTVVAQDHVDVTDITYNFSDVLTWAFIDLFFSVFIASAPMLPTQAFKSWSALFNFFSSRLSSHISPDSSNQASSKKSPSKPESNDNLWHDELERKYAAPPKRDHDIESGQNRLLDDKDSLGNHSIRAPDRLYLHGEDFAH